MAGRVTPVRLILGPHGKSEQLLPGTPGSCRPTRAPKRPLPGQMSENTVSRPRRSWSSVLGWIKAKDPGLLAIKRSAPGRGRHAHGLRTGASAFRQPTDQPLRGVRLVRPVAPRGLPGRPRTRLLSYAAFFCGELFHRSWYGRLRPTKSAAVANDGGGGVRRCSLPGSSPRRWRPRRRPPCWSSCCRWPVAGPASAVGPRLVGWVLAGVLRPSRPACSSGPVPGTTTSVGVCRPPSAP